MVGVAHDLADPASFLDAYLRWFIATRFDVFKTPTREGDAAAAVGLLIEWKSTDDAVAGGQLIGALKLGIWVSRVYAGPPRVRRFWAISVRTADLVTLLHAIGPRVHRVELASPVQAREFLGLECQRPRQSVGPVFAAVLDDGCAFANRRFRQGPGTRVIWLWDQDAAVGGRPLDGNAGPSLRADLGYGRQWAKRDLDTLMGAGVGGEESSVYQAMGAVNLRRSVVHGTHVMDLFAGAKEWEIAFVQFPSAGIDDPSGRWLARYALDGLHYVLECAGPDAETIVVNLSWGPQTGPHNGRSALELAIDELVAEQAAFGRELIICLPSGNSYGARAHGCVNVASGGRLNWNVPPDGETPAFLELWWPEAVAPCDIRLRITPPGGASSAIGAAGASIGDGSWFAIVQQSPLQGVMVLLAVNPTGGQPNPASPRGAAGSWAIVIDPCPDVPGSSDDIHLYVARADHNMGARRRAKASYLTDPALGAARFRAAVDRDAEAPGSSLRRAGTLNGLATGVLTRVATGYAFDGSTNARYSSSGPARNGRLPDFSCVTDRSRVRQGVAAAGVRSGTTAILVGTSTAAPQMARQFGSGSLAEYQPVPPAPPCRDGEIRLWPDDELIHKP